MNRRVFVLSAAGVLLGSTIAVGSADGVGSRPSGVPATVSHGAWGELLARFVERGADGVNRVRYGELDPGDREELTAYLAALESVEPSHLDRDDRLAYWINLYNALTVDVVLEHWPVDSVRDIDISPGLFADGPWKRKLVTVEGERLSLDDIEHGILRVEWDDPRVHYALNCASLGCPNLRREPFTGATVTAMLDEAAREYVNHPRGARVENGRLIVSSIYRWFEDDFGGSERAVLEHLRRYAEGDLRRALETRRRIDRYTYDWSINAATRPPSRR